MGRAFAGVTAISIGMVNIESEKRGNGDASCRKVATNQLPSRAVSNPVSGVNNPGA